MTYFLLIFKRTQGKIFKNLVFTLTINLFIYIAYMAKITGARNCRIAGSSATTPFSIKERR